MYDSAIYIEQLHLSNYALKLVVILLVSLVLMILLTILKVVG